MKVIFAGGGTAGHVNPAVAIAQEILKHDKDSDIMFVGNKNSIEQSTAINYGFDFREMRVTGFQRKLNFTNIKRNIKALYYMFSAKSASKKILLDFNPDIVIGTGGYVSGPILLQASNMGFKTLIHEQNAFPGVTTKILSKHVDGVMLTTEKAIKYIPKPEKCLVTGLPVRQSIINTLKEDARKKYNVRDRFCILSFGGSLGARPINENILKLIKWEVDNNINTLHIHATGKAEYEQFIFSLKKMKINVNSANLIIKPYIDDMELAMKAADIIISRAGASTINEIAAAKKASILIPSPYVSENHQYYNAKILHDKNAAVIIEEKDLTGDMLIQSVNEFLEDSQKLKSYSDNAFNAYVINSTEIIYDIIKNMM